jgi:hypothetical protein
VGLLPRAGVLYGRDSLASYFLKGNKMQTILTSVFNPVWANAERTAIDCRITTLQFGDEILPFTAAEKDIEPHGRAIFAALVAGDYGPIAEYVAPLEPVMLAQEQQPTVIGAQTL